MKFELDDFQRNTPIDEFINDIRSVAELLNKNTLTTREYDKYGKFHSRTIFKRFSSWLQALELAGLQKSSQRSRGSSVEDLFKNIEEIWTRLGRQPRFRDMVKPLSRYGVKPYILKFGSWRNALESFIKFINEPQDMNLAENKAETIKIKKSKPIQPENLRKTKRIFLGDYVF